MLKNKLLVMASIISIPLGFYAYNSDSPEQSNLTSKNWHSNVTIFVPKEEGYNEEFVLSKVHSAIIDSDFKYLNDKSYIQNSFVEVFDSNNNILFSLELSNMGKWEYDQGYLFLEAGDVHDIATVRKDYITQKDIERLKDIFIVDMLQVRKIDRISEDTMLMTSVENDSKLWIAH
ncbi:regulatory protein ToxS [Vibrio algarum]|uniref:Regulatory protein ToxS n=1 Tax=Vibrio algarum TaxID=3020714 RepID=A0ABT4YVB2_9VIBR|nr:regulatory protein ToxS [Vibrio sp. KJ40-1]MDB1125395.1 regulatory protein ToxS [Vibrio sp. KJ40-1]